LSSDVAFLKTARYTTISN